MHSLSNLLPSCFVPVLNYLLPSPFPPAVAVLSLGEVEWLHPAFHNEKFIFPPGYRAERTLRKPNGSQQQLSVPAAPACLTD